MRPEYKALLLLTEPERAIRYERRLIEWFRRPDFDWALFTNTAEGKLVAPFVLLQLRRHELLDLVPPVWRAKMRDVYETVAMRNAVLLHDLAAAGKTLAAAGIEWIPLKGSALLSRGVYPDRGLRLLSDLDVLVRPERCEEAFELLKRQGYRVLVDNEPDARHMPPLVNSRGTVIELHRGIGNQVALHVPVIFDEFRDNFYESLRTHLCLHHDRDAKLLLRGQVDLWFLNKALVANGLRPSPIFENRGAIARTLPVSNRYEEVLYTRPEGWWRLLFPRREEMEKRHGDAARGAGIYRLYAARLVRLRRQLPTLTRNLGSYAETLRPGG